MVVEVDRARVVAYRVSTQEFDEAGDGTAAGLAALTLGVQDTPYGSAALALAARHIVPDDTAPEDNTSNGLSLVWSLRGAPHLHSDAALPALASALWPLSDADARARIANSAIREGAKLGLSAFDSTAGAVRELATEWISAGRTDPIGKGELSEWVSARVPPTLTYWCRSCQSQHVSGGLLQQVGLPGGMRLRIAGQVATFLPVADWPGVPDKAAGTEALVLDYLRMLGPATPAEIAKFLGTNQTAARPAWPADGLTEVRDDGRKAWLPAERVDALRAAPEPRLVRLLAPGDPYLQARDRDFLLPDKTRHKILWPVLGYPGALMVDGEIAGIWRVHKAGKAGVEVEVTPFGTLPARVRAAIEQEAGWVARARRVSDVRVTIKA